MRNPVHRFTGCWPAGRLRRPTRSVMAPLPRGLIVSLLGTSLLLTPASFASAEGAGGFLEAFSPARDDDASDPPRPAAPSTAAALRRLPGRPRVRVLRLATPRVRVGSRAEPADRRAPPCRADGARASHDRRPRARTRARSACAACAPAGPRACACRACAPGSYRVRVTVLAGAGERALAPRTLRLTVRRKPRPVQRARAGRARRRPHRSPRRPRPSPQGSGVFPVQGSYSFGGKDSALRRRPHRPHARGPRHLGRRGRAGRRAAGRRDPLQRLPGAAAPAATSCSTPTTAGTCSSPTCAPARRRSSPGTRVAPGQQIGARRLDRRLERPAPALRDLARRLAPPQGHASDRPAAAAARLGRAVGHRRSAAHRTRDRRRAPAAAEQRGVREQRHDLPERDALLVAGGERRDLLVGGEEPLRPASRTAAASRGRPRDGRRRPRGRSATARPSAAVRTLPLQRSPCRRAGGSGGPASSSSRPTSALEQRGRLGRAARRGRRAAGRAARAGAWRRTRPSSRAGALGSVSGPSTRSRSPPNAGAPAACSAASPRPSASSRRGRRRARARSTRARGSAARRARRRPRATAATGSAPRLGEPAQARRPRRVNAPGAASAAVLTNTRRAVVELGGVGVVEVAAGDPRSERRRPERAPSARGDSASRSVAARARGPRRAARGRRRRRGRARGRSRRSPP